MNRPRDTVLFRELATLVTEGFLPESTEIDTMDTLGILRVIHEQDRLVAPAVWECAPEITRVVDRVTESFRRGGRLIYIGAGTSGRLGILDAAERPPTFGTDPEEVVGIIAGGKDSVFRAREGAEDDADAGARAIDEHAVGPADTVVGIAASRRTPYVRAALARARERGAFAALVTCNPSSSGPDDGDVDVVIAPVVGAEVIAGSTRMKAGTAQKLVLNMISTAAMVRRGKTLGNLMIDLRPGSAKLVERSRGIVARVVDCGYDEAARLLDESGGSVKTAIVMGRRAVDRAAAERILVEAGGFVRQALLAGGRLVNTLARFDPHRPMNVLGLISGTSVDGIDAALAEIQGEGADLRLRQIAFATVPYADPVRKHILAVARGEPRSAAELSRLDHTVGDAFGAAGLRVLAEAGVAPERVDLVGSHGQTIFHDGDRRETWQIGEPTRIAESIGAPVVSDFRRADLAAGGHGAPLVPLFDALVFRKADTGRILLNIGGIANVTVLPKGKGTDGVFAFDTGPGNVLIDEFLSHASGGRICFDEGGRLAARGEVDEDLLEGFLEHPYFYEKPPKSTGREVFGAGFVALTLGEWGRRGERIEDVVATLTEFTALSIAGSIREYVLPAVKAREVLVSGGGAHNETLMRRIAAELDGLTVASLEVAGFSADAKEALAFAVLARETVLGRPGNVPGATGASRPVVLGKITPGRRV